MRLGHWHLEKNCCKASMPVCHMLPDVQMTWNSVCTIHMQHKIATYSHQLSCSLTMQWSRLIYNNIASNAGRWAKHTVVTPTSSPGTLQSYIQKWVFVTNLYLTKTLEGAGKAVGLWGTEAEPVLVPLWMQRSSCRASACVATVGWHRHDQWVTFCLQPWAGTRLAGRSCK